MFNIQNLKKYLLTIFDLEESELKKTLLLQLNIFLLITTLLIVKPVINSLFLSELTADGLPLGYVLTALMAIVGSWFYNKALEKYSLNVVIERTILGAVLSLVIFGFLFNFGLGNGAFMYVPYIWMAIFGLLTASQFWILANLVYNVREAKRVFGFIGAGAIAGGIFGGYLTSILTNIINAEYLLFIAAFLLLGCLPITRYIWRTEVVKLNQFQVSLRTKPQPESAFKLIKRSKLLTLIAIAVGISVLVAKLVDYQYSDYASRLIEDPEELAAFFGFWFSTLSVISLLIQLFLTKRIVGTFGVGKSLLWLPAGIMLGSFLLLFLPQLWVIVFIKVIDGSFKQSVNKAATELLSIPIPIEIKKKTKTFTDVVVDSIATGLAGFILIFFINGLDISSTYISVIIIILIAFWLYFIYQLRKEYIVAFKKLLTNSTEVKEKSVKTQIPITSIVDTVNRVFRNGSDGQIIYMLKKTLEVKDERFFAQIKKLLLHSSPEIRVLAIENLYYLKSENLSKEMEEMIHDDDQQVTTKAFRYLLKHYNADTLELFNKYLHSEDHTIANASLVGLSLELRYNARLQSRYNLKMKVEEAINQLVQLQGTPYEKNRKAAILEAIGNARISSLYSFIEKQLSDPSLDTEELTSALKAASKTLDPGFIDQIATFLSNKDVRKVAINGLYNYGNPIIDLLKRKIKANEFELDDAVQAVSVIEKFASQSAVETLMKLTDGTEHSVKIEAIEALRRLKWKNNLLKINDRFVIDKVLDECNLYQDTLAVTHAQIIIQYKKKNQHENLSVEDEARSRLIQLLESRLDRQLQRIFRLLGIKYPPNDMDPIFDSIVHGKEEQRIHAIEFLDNILDSQLKKELIPVAESMLIESISDAKVKMLNLKVMSEEECYMALLKRRDAKLKQAVLYLIEKTGEKRFIPIIEAAAKDSDEKIQSRALEILEALR